MGLVEMLLGDAMAFLVTSSDASPFPLSVSAVFLHTSHRYHVHARNRRGPPHIARVLDDARHKCRQLCPFSAVPGVCRFESWIRRIQ
ncbi:hypothetical protein F5141DRAFT_1147957 [Pisolithus sp. B1]|nr:hypothetical protein F5141DRAFT_1147957 [Pisolithus sp. B1]